MLRDVGKLFSSPRVMQGLVRHLLVAALFFSAAFGMGGCSGEVSVDQKFVDLFVELRVAEITYGKDSPMGRLVRQDILNAAGYTREQFLAKTEEILNDERQWVPFQKAVNARIDSLLALPAEKANAPEIKSSRKLQTQMPAHKGGVK